MKFPSRWLIGIKVRKQRKSEYIEMYCVNVYGLSLQSLLQTLLEPFSEDECSSSLTITSVSSLLESVADCFSDDSIYAVSHVGRRGLEAQTVDLACALSELITNTS